MVVELEPEPPDGRSARPPDRPGRDCGTAGRAGRMSAPEVAPVRSTKRASSMLTMLTALLGFVHAARGQGNAVTAGLAYTVGGGWQVEGLDFGVARAVHAGPIAALSLTRADRRRHRRRRHYRRRAGFIFGTSSGRPHADGHDCAARRGTRSRGQIGLDFTVETTGYVGSHSPLAVGSPWGAATGLLGLRFGDPNGSRLGLLIGPTGVHGQPSRRSGRSSASGSKRRWRAGGSSLAWHRWRSPPSIPSIPVIRVIAEVASVLQAGLASGEALHGVVGALRRGLNLRRCRIWLRTPDGTRFTPVTTAR